MKKIKYCALIFFLIVLFFSGRALWFSIHKSQGFSLSKMKASLPHRKEWEITPLPPAQQEQLQELLRQKFHFLSSGYQSYAFISEDEKTIIKFFRMKRLTSSLTDPFFHPKKVKEHKKNLEAIFNAYKLAYEEMREDAGLLYIHLNQSNDLKTRITISDYSGKEQKIDLDGIYFIVQERAEPLFNHLHALLGDQEKFSLAINSFIDLVKRRLSKGIADADKGISENYGFIGDRPIQFDIGRIYKGKEEGEYEEICRRLDWWLRLNSPM